MLSKHVGYTQSTTNNSECSLHVCAWHTGSTRLQARSGSVGSARALRRGGCSLCATNNSQRGDSGLCTVRQGCGVQHKGADSAATRSVSSDESGPLGIRGGNDGSTGSTRENDTDTILIGSGHNIGSASTTGAAAWLRCVDRGDDITILVNSNTGNR
jgi:hypothetical protein